VSAPEPLSLREYARRRGCTLRAVQNAIKTTRLNASIVLVDGLSKIGDPELADREWAANTDQTRRAGAAAPAPGHDGAGADDDSSEDTFAHWKAKKMRLDYEKAAGALVNAAEMQAAMADDYSMVRTKLLGLASKAKQRLPHLTLSDLATLDAIVREALEELAEDEATDDGEHAA
jgi:phage terminase Nu1 subunit (DNA packaging protein)